MHYKINAQGRFKNISAIHAEQTLPIILKCGHCLQNHPKTITLTSESRVHNDHHEKSNLKISCKECKNSMELQIKPPTNEKVECQSSNVYRSIKISDEQFLVSEVFSKGCEVVEIPLNEFFVQDLHENIYKANIDEDGNWVVMDRANDAIIIEELSIKLEELKH